MNDHRFIFQPRYAAQLCLLTFVFCTDADHEEGDALPTPSRRLYWRVQITSTVRVVDGIWKTQFSHSMFYVKG